MKGKELLEHLKESIGEELKGERYGDAEAIVGFDYNSLKLVFSIKKSIEFLMQRDGMDYETAKEFIFYNYVDARGSDEPVWLNDII